MGALERVVQALSEVKRVDFLPKESKIYADLDQPLHIGFNQTNSQPTTVITMLSLLDIRVGDSILDVGSGSGWTTALLAYLTGPKGRVVGVEKILQLVKFGKKNLSAYSFSWAKILKSDEGVIGWPSEGPYDKILVSATSQSIPDDLINQLRCGGKMVLPIQNSVYLLDKKDSGDLKTTEFPGFAFVPLVP